LCVGETLATEAFGPDIFVLRMLVRCQADLDCTAPDYRRFHRLTANHDQTREHGQPKGEAAQHKCGGKARFETPTHEMKKSSAGTFEGAKTEGDR